MIIYVDRKTASVSLFICLNDSNLSVLMFEFLRSWNIIIIILIIISSYCGALVPSGGEQRHFSPAGINLLSSIILFSLFSGN